MSGSTTIGVAVSTYLEMTGVEWQDWEDRQADPA
jgi:hypothetical protein